MDVLLLKTDHGCSTENGLSVERPEAERTIRRFVKNSRDTEHRSRNLNERKRRGGFES